MQVQTLAPSSVSSAHSLHQPNFSLQHKPTCFYKKGSQISIGLSNFSIANFDQQKFSISYKSQALHEGRINCIKRKQNLIVTGSNDFTVKLWDERIDFSKAKPIHTFQKPGSQFNCIDMTHHILCGAHTSKMVFWDLRKMKQRAEFNDSFNGEITCLQLDEEVPTRLMGCSADGMINRFDLTEPNEEEAFLWCNKILESPSHLQFRKDTTLVQTTSHLMYLLEGESVVDKIQVNSVDEPRHVISAQLQQDLRTVQYYAWNLQKQYLQKTSQTFGTKEQTIDGYVQGVSDVELFVPLGGKGVFWLDEQGKGYIGKTTRKLKTEDFPSAFQSEENYSKFPPSNIVKTSNDCQMVDENGFVLNKPTSFKSKVKKFKPF